MATQRTAATLIANFLEYDPQEWVEDLLESVPTLDEAWQQDANVTIGASGAGYDLKAFGSTAGSYMLWDASDDALELEEATMAFGALSSVTTNLAGVTLSASGNTSVLDVFADDHNTKLTDAVYTTFRSRTMIYKAMTAGTVIGARGQLKLYDEADLGPGVYAGVQGYIEPAKDFDVKSGGKVWAVDACLEAPSSGTVTIDSGGIMGAVHCELTGSGTFTNNGTLAGVYIDEQVTSGTWGYGVYVTGADIGLYVAAASTLGVQVGAHGNTAGDGLDMGSVTALNRFHGDDGGSALTGNRRNVLSRVCVTAEHTGALTLSSVVGQMKLYNGVDFDGDYLAGVWGYLELDGACDFALNSAGHAASAVRARVEVGGDIDIETADTFLAGVYAELNTTGSYTVTQTGELAAFVAIATDQVSDNWGSVIYVDGADYFAKFKSGSAYEDSVKIADGLAGDAGAEGKVGFDALLRCDIGGTPYYIALFDADSVTEE